MRGRFMLFICDKVLNARYLKKGTLWNIKIKIPKSQIHDKRLTSFPCVLIAHFPYKPIAQVTVVLYRVRCTVAPVPPKPWYWYRYNTPNTAAIGCELWYSIFARKWSFHDGCQFRPPSTTQSHSCNGGTKSVFVYECLPHDKHVSLRRFHGY